MKITIEIPDNMETNQLSKLLDNMSLVVGHYGKRELNGYDFTDGGWEGKTIATVTTDF